jgi:predicted nucleic acid-binding protein
MIAAMCDWHDHHQRAWSEIERRIDQGDTLVTAGPAAVEAYAVLTRLPAPHRMASTDAAALIEANFLSGEVVALPAEGYRDLLREAPSRSIAGGQTYDAVIVQCAHAASVDTLLTFNLRHFQRLCGDGLIVTDPA